MTYPGDLQKKISRKVRLKPAPKAKVFKFLDYKLDSSGKEIEFNYRMEFFNRESLDFTDKIILPQKVKNISSAELSRYLEPLHLILGISYYKLYCPSKIQTPYHLSNEQADFWYTVYAKGLGEFLYKNKLDVKMIARFPIKRSSKNAIPDNLNGFNFKPDNKRVLLGIGGGKDSIVAAELLKGKYETASFLVETQKEDPLTRKVMQEIGNDQIIIQRFLDQKIFVQHEGSYNGHIPISAVFSFMGLLAARLYGYRYFVVGNEQSSNFGNLKYRGITINHQWSKSMEYEAMLQAYTRLFITPHITYFSILRQFNEIRVAKMFSQYKKYFPLFASCNRNFKVHKERPDSLWCGECPKCAFVFLMLAAFVSKKELVKIFNKNLLNDASLLPLYRDLLGYGQLKPFDCVGTFDESRSALYLASKKYKNSIVVKNFLMKIKQPDALVRDVMRTSLAPTLPAPFRFLGIDNVAILGFGHEGKVNKKFIQKFYPGLKISILDQKKDKNYLSRQNEFDLAIKTPGLPKTKATIPYVTATNLFFANIDNYTIGVTGTKGKSTVVSLIYEMLKAGGKKVRLLGNIGHPMLEVLLGETDPKEIFVIELSSYMLDDIEYSPNVAVLLNLFPEHMPYHGGLENYYSAKKNIFKFQAPGDTAFTKYHEVKLPVQDVDIPLLGQHNKNNIKAAVKAARLLGIKEKAIARAIKAFKPLPHRLEYIGNFKKVDFYDDAISTTPESTIQAIKTLKKVDTILLGGEDRGYDFKNLEKELRSSGIKNIVLFPDTGRRILQSNKGFNVLKTKNMKDAVRFSYQHTAKGRICLLSTASPSYSLWKNFQHKGEEFKKYVKIFSH